MMPEESPRRTKTVSDSMNPGQSQNDPRDERRGPRRPAGEPRLTPSVKFGLQAAEGDHPGQDGGSVGMSASINALGPADTTCCGTGQVSRTM
jgi:hypothetical protein